VPLELEVGVTSAPWDAEGMGEVEGAAVAVGVGADKAVVDKVEVCVEEEADVGMGVGEVEGIAAVVAVGIDEGLLEMEVELGVTGELGVAVGVAKAEGVGAVVALGVAVG